MMRRIVAACLIHLVAFPPLSSTQEDSSSEIVIEFETSLNGFQLGEAESTTLADRDIDRTDTLELMDQLRSYQLSRGEGLGLELSFDATNTPSLIVRPDVETDQIVVSLESLSLADRSGLIGDRANLGRPSFDSPETVLQPDTINPSSPIIDRLVDALGGRGALDASNINSSFQVGTDRTTNPIGTGVSLDRLAQLRDLPCLKVGTFRVCDDIQINPDVLVRVVESFEAPDTEWWLEEDTAEFKCRTARDLFFYEIEGNPEIKKRISNWRSIDGAEENAAPFDQNCLTGPEGISEDILERLAVLRMPNIEQPFCTAFRIDSTSFLTAKHCFHNSDSGRPFDERIKRSQLFLYDAPATPVEFDRSNFPEILDTSGEPKGGAKREIRAVNDIILLQTDAAPGDPGELSSSDPIIGEEIIIPGYYVFADRQEGPPVTYSTWANEVRITKELGEGYCRIYDISVESEESGCLIHRCQAVSGFSGSPILQRSASGELSLVGVHVRGAGHLDHHCSAGFLLGERTAPENSNLGAESPMAQSGNIGSLTRTNRIESLRGFQGTIGDRNE